MIRYGLALEITHRIRVAVEELETFHLDVADFLEKDVTTILLDAGITCQLSDDELSLVESELLTLAGRLQEEEMEIISIG